MHDYGCASWLLFLPIACPLWFVSGSFMQFVEYNYHLSPLLHGCVIISLVPHWLTLECFPPTSFAITNNASVNKIVHTTYVCARIFVGQIPRIWTSSPKLYVHFKFWKILLSNEVAQSHEMEGVEEGYAVHLCVADPFVVACHFLVVHLWFQWWLNSTVVRPFASVATASHLWCSWVSTLPVAGLSSWQLQLAQPVRRSSQEVGWGQSTPLRAVLFKGGWEAVDTRPSALLWGVLHMPRSSLQGPAHCFVQGLWKCSFLNFPLCLSLSIPSLVYWYWGIITYPMAHSGCLREIPK